jgi:nicotinate-nucleotide--dimethylbenzimidazole phosphoribosyltransferase
MVFISVIYCHFKNYYMNSLKEQLQYIIDHKTKPLGALGRLEEIALQVGLIQETTSPVIRDPHIILFAGDHGIAATGLVNAYPQAVTTQMVFNFINGGAAINVFCKQNNIKLKVVDAGVNYDFDGINRNEFIDSKIANGTKNYAETNAMSEQEVISAIEKGKQVIAQIASTGCNCIGLGEMGIGNTSSASLIMSAITRLSIEVCTGRGAGADNSQLQTKIKTLKQVYTFHELQHYYDKPIQLLSKVGGFEIAMLAGAYIQAAGEKMIIVVDGFISTAALLVAKMFNPQILENCIFAHTSGEKGHEQMLAYLNAKPLLNLGLRLGEGTGSALAIPLIQSSVNFLNEMASFESAGVSSV